MIAKNPRSNGSNRGSDVAGLIRYQYGPGRSNEHTDQHLVAVWGDERVADWEGKQDELISAMRQPLTAAGIREEKRVYHLILSVDRKRDRSLTDAEWADVAREHMDRVGLAPRDDSLGSVRWVAIRHADDHVHVVATLARQNGKQAWLPTGDHYLLRDASMDMEVKYDLVRTPPADRTATRTSNRAEVEKAARQREWRPNGAETDRDVLRREVRAAAAASTSEAEFFDRLERGGVVDVVKRMSQQNEGEVTGYRVALVGGATAATTREKLEEWQRLRVSRPDLPRPEPTSICYSGSTLHPDLSLPRLRRGWDGGEPVEAPRTAEGGRAVWAQAERAAVDATRALEAGRSPGDIPAGAVRLAAATGRAVEGARSGSGDLAVAADRLERAAGEPYRRPLVATGEALALRQAARAVSALGRVAGPEAAAASRVVAALVLLAAAIAEAREAQARAAQAAAARQAAQAAARAQEARAAAARAQGAAQAARPVAGQAPVVRRRPPQGPRPGRHR